MKRLRLYVDERGRLALNHSGFSWLAAISIPIWALQRRLYLVAIAGFALSTAVNHAHLGIPPGVAFAVQFVLFGASANRLHRWWLERRGWHLTAEEPDPKPR